MTTKTKPVCPECGSENIVLDATADWDAVNQCWEVVNTCENGWCNSDACRGPDGMNDTEFRCADWIDAGLDPLPAAQQPRLTR